MSQLALFNNRTGAVFSPCRRWRYQLWRTWSEGPKCMFCGLNPSTADETVDDNTVRRCVQFAKLWGCGGIFMMNIFAYRATDPIVMKAQADPVGPDNDSHLCEVANICEIRVACWGVHGAHRERGKFVAEMIKPLQCFGLTNAGFPKHPLYLPKTAELVDYCGDSV